MAEKMKVSKRQRLEWDIYLATACRKYDERDCVRLIKEATGRDIPMPEDGEDFDLLADLSNAEVAKVHAMITAEEC